MYVVLVQSLHYVTVVYLNYQSIDCAMVVLECTMEVLEGRTRVALDCTRVALEDCTLSETS